MQDRIGFGRRLGALFIDVIIIGVVGGFLGRMLFPVPEELAMQAVTAMMGGDPSAALNSAAQMQAIGMKQNAIMGLLGAIYGLQDVFMSGTLGKSILKIAIRDANGNHAPSNTLWTRYLVKYSSSIAAILGLVGLGFVQYLVGIVGLVLFIWTLTTIFGPTRQAAWDNIAKTAVYNKNAIVHSGYDAKH